MVKVKVYPVLEKFQFYDSPIKRAHSNRAASYSRRCFNSMIVRLKGIVKWFSVVDFDVSIL